MRKLFFVVVPVVVIAGAFASSVAARSQALGRFEYARLGTFSAEVRHPRFGLYRQTVGYMACAATTTEWQCREFRVEDSVDAGLRTALATLGSEGWELILSHGDETTSHPSYLLKRQVR